MTDYVKHCTFPGRLVMVGFGSIGQGVLPLILRHMDIAPERIVIVTADDRGHAEADHYGIRFIREPLTRANFRDMLTPLLGKGDFLLNLSVDVSSIALIELCAQVGALYLDTCIEPWPGGYTDKSVSPSRRSNYALREAALAVRKTYPNGPTAVLTHGANPGLVTHLMKQAMLNIAADTGMNATPPTDKAGWARLAHSLDIKVVHVAERDTQIASVPKRRDEFVNTWSIDGFISEGCQPAELGWGTHEKTFPEDGIRHDFGCQAGIILNRPGVTQRVRTWTPNEGPFHGFLITHGESISIPDYLSVRDAAGNVIYRPTCHYSYHPCDDAVKSIHEFAGKNYTQQAKQRLMMAEIIEGIDELGVLLAGHKKGAYWYGSQLDIHEARKLAPYNSATSLQVCIATLSGVIWAIENPDRGVVEPEEMDYRRCLDICLPYLGPVVGAYTDWTPLEGRNKLFPEDIDESCPWQFKNIRVA